MAKETIKKKIEDLVTHSAELGETAIKLARVNASRTTANVSAALMIRIVLSVILFIALLFSSFAAAWWVGDVLHSRIKGFLLVGAFYFLIFLLVLALKEKIFLPFLRNKVIKKIYE
jgi:hypothetical protein